jgi:hypothetical protein
MSPATARVASPPSFIVAVALAPPPSEGGEDAGDMMETKAEARKSAGRRARRQTNEREVIRAAAARR